ncbi:MAG: ABC transporter substrate-binding protein [Trueperaceae bacterium]|nr:ABC transporter substrate-binding protein [Trueperaceae bacterium]
MKPNRPYVVKLCVFLSIVVLSFVQSQADSEGGVFSVGIVLPLTGSLEEVGKGVLRASELALEEINNLYAKKIRFIVEDSGSTAEGAAEAFTKLIKQEGVTAIIGPVTSSAAKMSFPIAQDNRVLTLSPLAAASGLAELGDYVFQANLTTDVVIPGGVKLTQERLAYKKVAVLVDRADLFSQSTFEVLEKTFVERELELVVTQTLETGDTDLSSQITRIKEAKPDVIFISTLPLEAVQILKQLRAQDLEQPIIIPFAFSTDEIALAGDNAEGVITFSTWTSFSNSPGNSAFVENYSAKYGSPPSRFLAQGYASVYLFAQALNTTRAFDSDGLRDALSAITDFDTILGKFSFDERGRAIYDPIILVVKQGDFEVFR